MNSLLPISSRLLLHTNHSSFLFRLGRRTGGVATEKLFFSSQLSKKGLALQKLLALVQQGKRKQDFSVTSMAASTSHNPYLKDHRKPAPWRRNAENLSASIFVDPPLLGFLIGKGGGTKRKIEQETGVTLLVPSSREAEAGKRVVLQGKSKEALDKATHEVHEVIDQAIKSPQLQYTHFISIPLALHSKLVESVVEFQKSVLLEYGASHSGGPGLKDKGIDKSIFVKPATFHLTLLMLKLWNKDRVQAAANCLQRVMPRVHEALRGSPLTIKLKGVDCMQGNHAQAHVLYADVEPDDQALRLITASQVITEAFTEAGLVMESDQTRPLRLHATLMTSSLGTFPGNKYQGKIPFDATEIMTQYAQYEWGRYPVSEAHLSQRFLYDRNGYYHCCSSIPFPSNLKTRAR